MALHLKLSFTFDGCISHQVRREDHRSQDNAVLRTLMVILLVVTATKNGSSDKISCCVCKLEKVTLDGDYT